MGIGGYAPERASALGCMGAEAQEAAPALAAALQDDSEWVCRNAADALGNMGQVSAAVPALTQALDDSRAMTPWSLSDAPLRENAAMTLAKWKAPATALQRARQQDNEYVWSWAEWGVGPPLRPPSSRAGRVSGSIAFISSSNLAKVGRALPRS